MSRPHLYNFHAHTIPEPIPELLALLGFWAFWDSAEKVHRIYETVEREPRMRWKFHSFKGGTVPQWQAFLSAITASEHLR
jgi:hypothetical protein